MTHRIFPSSGQTYREITPNCGGQSKFAPSNVNVKSTQSETKTKKEEEEGRKQEIKRNEYARSGVYRKGLGGGGGGDGREGGQGERERDVAREEDEEEGK